MKVLCFARVAEFMAVFSRMPIFVQNSYSGRRCSSADSLDFVVEVEYRSICIASDEDEFWCSRLSRKVYAFEVAPGEA